MQRLEIFKRGEIEPVVDNIDELISFAQGLQGDLLYKIKNMIHSGAFDEIADAGDKARLIVSQMAMVLNVIPPLYDGDDWLMSEENSSNYSDYANLYFGLIKQTLLDNGCGRNYPRTYEPLIVAKAVLNLLSNRHGLMIAFEHCDEKYKCPIV